MEQTHGEIRHFKDILYSLRSQKGISQAALAKALHRSAGTIGMWENGTRMPSRAAQEEIADYFNVSLDYLNGRDSKASSGAVTISVLGHVAAGIPLEAIENVEGREEIPAAMVKDGSEYFGLKIHGDSMSPRMKEGDVVIVRKQDDAESGDIVIALVNGNEATCKRLKKYSDRIALISFNPEYDPMVFTPEDVQKKPVRIIGKVVELRAKF